MGDPEGKRFDRVSRLHCESESFKMDLILDINSWIYPMDLADKFRLVLASSLREDALQIRGSGVPWTLGLAELTALNMLCMAKSTESRGMRQVREQDVSRHTSHMAASS